MNEWTKLKSSADYLDLPRHERWITCVHCDSTICESGYFYSKKVICAYYGCWQCNLFAITKAEILQDKIPSYIFKNICEELEQRNRSEVLYGSIKRKKTDKWVSWETPTGLREILKQ